MSQCDTCRFYVEERDTHYFDCLCEASKEEIDKYWGTKLDCPFWSMAAGLGLGRYE